MKAIAFVTQKGGSGKSTLCINLAIAGHGSRDAPSASWRWTGRPPITDWAEHREGEGPEVAQIDATQLDDVIERLREFDYDYVFIDTPGVDSPGGGASRPSGQRICV